jgi:hypothetical protein
MIDDGPQVSSYLSLPFSQNVGAVVTGFLVLPVDGQYALYFRAEDAGKLYIDGSLAINAHNGWATDVSQQLSLTAGPHAIRVEGYHGGYWHALALSIEGPGIARQVVPAVAFYHGTLRSPADFNQDGHVDSSDYAILQSCASGPAVAHNGTPACQATDLDHDNDVDQADFGVFQRCFSGPTGTPPANCGT